MKEIQPVIIWYNGIIVSATIYNMTSISDNLIDTATFYWQLFTTEQIQVAQGNITMGGADYTNYSSNPNSNEYAYQWGATQLNLTLV
jgi:multimeric flavodoxin WrbA